MLNKYNINKEVSVFIPQDSIRNIGIIAHIDAGKTTCTERIIFYAGLIHKTGEVHHGSTTTDYLVQEKERGITIVSAAIQLTWNNCTINLIDTPGHIDFNIEVERCLSILDGAVVIIDGSAGVESQTECVWGQADKYSVARIIFVNKMDKVGASFPVSMNSLASRLSSHCIAVVEPVYNELDVFIGTYSLIDGIKTIWHGKDHIKEVTIYDSWEEQERAAFDIAKSHMLDKISFYSDEIMHLLLENKSVSYELIFSEVQRLTRLCKIYPVSCGTAFHNKGVQFVLDMVCNFLPSPLEQKLETRVYDNYENKASGKYHLKSIECTDPDPLVFVFKLVHDSYSGAIAYARVYSGCITKDSLLYNQRTGKKLKIQNIVKFYADKKTVVSHANSGDIVGLVTKDAYTGDTVHNGDINYKISKIDIPESVVSMAIRPSTKNDQDKLFKFIDRFLKEDPTLKLSYNHEQSETHISGVGVLQIMILLDRLKSEHNIAIDHSKPKVNYRETITQTTKQKYLHKKQTGGAGQFAGIEIIMEPSEQDFEFVDRITGGAIPKQFIPEIKKSCIETLEHGIILNSRVIGVKITLIDGDFHSVDSSSDAYATAAREVVKQALKEAGAIVLEPIFRLVANTPGEYMNAVIGHIYSQKGKIINVTKDEKRSVDIKIINADMKLDTLFDYAEQLRSITKGMASCSYSFLEYRAKT